MKYTAILLITLCTLHLTLQAQTLQWKELAFVAIDDAGTLLEVDNLDNAYLLRNRFELLKYDRNGRLRATYSNTRFGPLDLIDPTNPLNLLLYYRAMNTVVIVDNELGDIGTYQLAFMGYTDLPVVGTSQDNMFWVFDNTTMQLKKINNQGQVMASSENLLALGLTLPARPTRIVARNNFVYMYVPGEGILTFDIYANYYRSYPLPEISSFQVGEQHLVYLREGKLYRQWLQGPRMEEVDLPQVETILQVRIGKERLFILSPLGLHIYTLN
jgi:hypothetical protein